MADKSAIEWTDATWPIVQGCDPLSQGCVGCYAVPLLWRMAHNPDEKISGPLQGVTEKHVNAAGETILRFTGKIALREDRLGWPLKWKQPRMIFVPSHGDVFHKDVPDEFIDKIFTAMERACWHTYQVLTKRSARQRDYVNRRYADRDAPAHIWFMASAEDQPNADERIPHLLATKAAVRGVSLEPLLGPIDLRNLDHLGTLRRDNIHGISAIWTGNAIGRPVLDWVIVGGESGPNARPMHPDWARSLRDQCKAAGVSYFFKQWGEYHPSNMHAHSEHECTRTPEAVHVSGGREYRPSEQFRLIAGCAPGWAGMCRLGKKAAGRLLDGCEHNEFPTTGG